MGQLSTTDLQPCWVCVCIIFHWWSLYVLLVQWMQLWLDTVCMHLERWIAHDSPLCSRSTEIVIKWRCTMGCQKRTWKSEYVIYPDKYNYDVQYICGYKLVDPDLCTVPLMCVLLWLQCTVFRTTFMTTSLYTPPLGGGACSAICHHSTLCHTLWLQVWGSHRWQLVARASGQALRAVSCC